MFPEHRAIARRRMPRPRAGFALILAALASAGCSPPARTPEAGPVPMPSAETAPAAAPSPTRSAPTHTDSPLPDISSFAEYPGGRFFLDAEGMQTVSRTYPFIGGGQSCAHRGAHTHFQGTGSAYTVDLFAPADGYIRMVTPCLNIGATDRYGFSLEFARSGGDLLVFNFSIEPQDGTPCAADPKAYAPYIFVEDGQKVQTGQLIGQMFKTADPADGAHIHFDVQNERTGEFHCPNIFNAQVTADFAARFGTDVCGGIPFPETFCFKPAPGEDLTGLFSVP